MQSKLKKCDEKINRIINKLNSSEHMRMEKGSKERLKGEIRQCQKIYDKQKGVKKTRQECYKRKEYTGKSEKDVTKGKRTRKSHQNITKGKGQKKNKNARNKRIKDTRKPGENTTKGEMTKGTQRRMPWKKKGTYNTVIPDFHHSKSGERKSNVT